MNKVHESKVGIGFDAYKEEMKAGILDPVKVTRSALENATSVASTLLTTEAAVGTIKEAKAAPAGSQGDVEGVRIPYTKEHIKSHFRDVDEQGRQCRKRYDAGKWRTYYPDAGMIPNDVWDIPYENSMSKNRLDYPSVDEELEIACLV